MLRGHLTSLDQSDSTIYRADPEFLKKGVYIVDQKGGPGPPGRPLDPPMLYNRS